jgi:hypothetical protein
MKICGNLSSRRRSMEQVSPRDNEESQYAHRQMSRKKRAAGKISKSLSHNFRHYVIPFALSTEAASDDTVSLTFYMWLIFQVAKEEKWKAFFQH